MSDTELTGKPKQESHFFHVSVRAWIAFVMACGATYMAVREIPMDPNFIILLTTVISFYYGQRLTPQTKPSGDQQINEKSTVINNPGETGFITK